MPVDKTELAKDLETPEYQELVRTTLAQKEFIIRTKVEDQEYTTRVKTDTLEKDLPAKIAEVHNGYDKDIKATFGADRLANEKTFDYLKRVGKEKVDAIAELEEKIRKGDTSGVREREQELARIEIAKRDTKIQELEGVAGAAVKNAAISLDYTEIKKSFKKATVPGFHRIEESILTEARQRSKVAEDGKLYMLEADGTYSKDVAFNKITVADFLRKEFVDYIEKKDPKGGLGQGGKAEKVDPTELTVDNFPMKEGIRTKGELMDYMLELGLVRGSAKFNEIYGKFAKKLTVLV